MAGDSMKRATDARPADDEPLVCLDPNCPECSKHDTRVTGTRLRDRLYAALNAEHPGQFEHDEIDRLVDIVVFEDLYTGAPLDNCRYCGRTREEAHPYPPLHATGTRVETCFVCGQPKPCQAERDLQAERTAPEKVDALIEAVARLANLMDSTVRRIDALEAKDGRE